jgi:hypothetical protein
LPKTRTILTQLKMAQMKANSNWGLEMTTRVLIGYVRVSTSQQGRSGLGIEAQREALARFAASEGFELVRVFVEVETGKGSDALERRPQLAAGSQRSAAATLLSGCHVALGAMSRLWCEFLFEALAELALRDVTCTG